MMGRGSQETDGELPLMTELTSAAAPFRSWGLIQHSKTTNFPASNSNHSAPRSPAPYDLVPTIDCLPVTTNRDGGEEVDPSKNKQQKSNPINGEEPEDGLLFRTAGAAKNPSTEDAYGRIEEHNTQKLQKGIDNGGSTTTKTQSMHMPVEFEEEERSESTAVVTTETFDDHRRRQSLHVSDDERLVLRRDVEKLGMLGSSDSGSRQELDADHDHEMPSVLQNWRQDHARRSVGRQSVHHRQINRQANNRHDKGRQRMDSAAAEKALSPLFLNPNHPYHNYGVHDGDDPFALEEPSVAEDDDEEEEDGEFEESNRSFLQLAADIEHAGVDLRRRHYYGSWLRPADDGVHALIRTANRGRDHRPSHMKDLQTTEQPIHSSGGFLDYEFDHQQTPHWIRKEPVSAAVAAGSMKAKESPNHRLLQQQQTPPKLQTSRITNNTMPNIIKQPLGSSPRRRWVNESAEQNRLCDNYMKGAAAAEPLPLLTELEDYYYSGSCSSTGDDNHGGCCSSINEDAREDAARSEIVEHAAAGRQYPYPRRRGSDNNINRSKVVNGNLSSNPFPMNVDRVRRDEASSSTALKNWTNAAGGRDENSKQGRTIGVHHHRRHEQQKTPHHALQLAAVDSRRRAGDEYSAAAAAVAAGGGRELVVSKLMECSFEAGHREPDSDRHRLAMAASRNNNGNYVRGEAEPRSLSQKHRPRRFREMVGQPIVTEALASSVARQKIAPVYLFHGPKGTGKTTAARIFCAALRCSGSSASTDSAGRRGRRNQNNIIAGGEEEGEPCGTCGECRAVAAGRSAGVKEVDAASYDGIDKVKALLQEMDGMMSSSTASGCGGGGGRICLRRTAEEEEQQQQRQAYHCYNVLVMDHCEALSPETWTALLPVMEEPPSGIVMVLVTTADAHRLPPTVASRCHRFPFLKLSPIHITARLRSIAAAERIPLDSHTIHLIAARSDGSLRDAETTLHQLSLLRGDAAAAAASACPTFYQLVGCASDERMVSLLDSALQGDVVATVRKARELLQNSGLEPLSLTTQLATLILDILAAPPGSFFPFSVAHKLQSRRTGFFTNQTLTGEKLERLRKAMTTLSQAEKQLRHYSNDRATWLTAALLQLGPLRSDDVRHSSNQLPHYALPPSTKTGRIPVVVPENAAAVADIQDHKVATPPMTDSSFDRRYEQAWLEHHDPCLSDQHLHPPPYKHIVGDDRDGSRNRKKINDNNNANEVGGGDDGERSNHETVAELQNVWRAVIEKSRSQPKLRQFLTTASIKLASISLSEDDAVVHLEARNAHQRNTCDRSKEIIATLFEAVLGFPVGVIVTTTTTTATLQQQQATANNSSKISPPYVSSTSSSDTAEEDTQRLAASSRKGINYGTSADSVWHRMIMRSPATEAERGANVDDRRKPPSSSSFISRAITPPERMIADVDRAIHQTLPEHHRSRILQGTAPEAVSAAAATPKLTVRQAMMQKDPPPQPPLRHIRSGTRTGIDTEPAFSISSAQQHKSHDSANNSPYRRSSSRISRNGASPITISTKAGQQMKTPPRSDYGFVSSPPAAPQQKNKGNISTVKGALAQLFRLKKLQGNTN